MYRGWTQTDYQNKHYNINQKDEGTKDGRGRDGGTKFILRIKEQETRLTLQEHDDDDDACNLKWTSIGTFKHQICLTIILRRTQSGLKCIDLSYFLTNFSPLPLATELYLKGCQFQMETTMNSKNSVTTNTQHKLISKFRAQKSILHTVKNFSATVNGLCEI